MLMPFKQASKPTAPQKMPMGPGMPMPPSALPVGPSKPYPKAPPKKGGKGK